ncbi:hypothetical protein, partial [Burkholderia pseudomultivorans]|uniref:hypothetical protein n=2 Tax=Burkholderia cepacia complex TaxID=87882 RepID=UPI00286FC86D
VSGLKPAAFENRAGMQFLYSIQLPDRVLSGSFAPRARLFFDLRNDMLPMPGRKPRGSLPAMRRT